MLIEKKNVFKKINDENLKTYINSLTQEKNNTLKIKYPKEHEYTIYKTGLLKDNYIWKNIYKIDIPCLIIRASDSNAFLAIFSLSVKIIPPPPDVIILLALNDKHPINPIVPVCLFENLPFKYVVPKLSLASSMIVIFLSEQIK